ncbi:DUF4179 domain-containing protein [Clostridium sp. C2-6-12]|uniref:DUF4179 domain-containing protein n=1 Tax=Clostridium sp. C2-6-12 TaxID=2698832 RepID=UPI00136CFA1B|nr:DUF4179 domain-containing protein [Clostridium sp. C2-6-12]
MISKKISKVLGTAFGVMGLMLAVGILEVPACAEDNLASSTKVESTTSAGVTYKDYFVNVNKTMEQNGLKVTLEKVVATKHKLKAVIKIESPKAFDTQKSDNSIIQLLYGENNFGGEGTSFDSIDDKTMIMTIEKELREGEFPQKGELRLDVVYPKYKVNIGMDANVDFSEGFNNVIDKDIEAKISEFDCTLKKLESDILGTSVTYTEPAKEHDDRFINSSLILKAGDKMYKLSSSGSSSDDKETKGNYESKALVYDKLKDQKDMSLIPLTSNITWAEIRKNNEGNKGNETESKVTTADVSYAKYFNFSDGTKGEITNIERNDNSVKLYCKAASEKASLLLASNMRMYYKFGEDTTNYSYYDGDKYMSFYKDPKEAFGYIVEFDNVEKDKVLELSVDSNIKLIDRYKVGQEIKLPK